MSELLLALVSRARIGSGGSHVHRDKKRLLVSETSLGAELVFKFPTFMVFLFHFCRAAAARSNNHHELGGLGRPSSEPHRLPLSHPDRSL